MFIVIGSLIFCCVVEGYIMLDEELIIVLASIFWVDAAGSFIKEIINSELVEKGGAIKKFYLEFLLIKKNTINKGLEFHKLRCKLEENFLYFMKKFYLYNFILEVLYRVFKNKFILDQFKRKADIISGGLLLVHDIVVYELNIVLNNFEVVE